MWHIMRFLESVASANEVDHYSLVSEELETFETINATTYKTGHNYPTYDYTGAEAEDHGDEEHFGVHIKFTELFAGLAFLSAVYGAGLFFSRILRMPSLVGEILVGIILGPNLLDIVPIEKAFVLLGEIGLILLVLEAGIDIDLTTLKLVGFRGTLIAIIGTILPVSLAICVAHALGYGGFTAIAAGCTFCPTSLGIAMNVLRRAGIVNTPTGQMIVAAAIIDDMIALVVLSQLQAFTAAQPSVLEMLIPLLSALGFLIGGGAIAVFIVPKVLDRYVFQPAAKYTTFDHDWLAMAIMFSFLLALVPITYMAKASPLMGAFLAGLCFCSNDGAHHMFVSQFKRLMQWLLRIFFAASIGFQVPVMKFFSGKVILEGLAFATALFGKVAVGFMVPNFGHSNRFRYTHLRDCLIVGFSMAAEGEFAFLIAVFGVSHGLFSKELYASIVLAVLLSTMVAPFCLQRTLAHFNKVIKQDVFGDNDEDVSLEQQLRDNKVVFWRIQIKSAPAWGLQTKIVEHLTQLDLDLIDHRAWHPRRSQDTLLNEIYAKDELIDIGGLSEEDARIKLRDRCRSMKAQIHHAIGQETAAVDILRWVPHIEYDDESGRDASKHIADVARSALEASIRRDASEEIAHLVRGNLSKSMSGGDKEGVGIETKSTVEGMSDTESLTETEGGPMPNNAAAVAGPVIRFGGPMYRGKLDGMFRQGHHSGGSRPSSQRTIGYGGYDTDEERYDHHGRTVAHRRQDPTGRRAADMAPEDEGIEVYYDRV